MPTDRPTVTFDPAKSEWNRQNRGLSFQAAERFDFSTALVREDDREDYLETRYQALGKIGREVVFLVFTRIAADAIRVISLRKATKQERSIWLAHHP